MTTAPPPDAPVPTTLTEHPGLPHLQFLIDCLRGHDPSDDQIGEHVAYNGTSATTLPTGVRRAVERHREQIGGFRVVDWSNPLPDVLDVELHAENGRTWRVAGRTPEAEGHRLSRYQFQPKPAEFSVRLARPEDAPRLVAVDASTPIVVGDVSVVYERDPDDYFADERLMGDASDSFVLERGEEIAGVGVLAVRDVQIGGVRRRAAAYTRARVVPSAQGSGARGHLIYAGFLGEIRRECDFAYSIVAAGNDAMRRHLDASGRAAMPERIVLDTASGVGAEAGRQAASSDAERIVALLNGTHEGEEFFLPYTVESLTARLSTAPDLYSWSDFRLGERSVVGVRRHAFRVRRRERADAQETVDSRALCLDYGFEPDAEAEFEALLRSVLADLAEHGDTELSVFTSPPSRGHGLLAGMAKRVEPYVVQLPFASDSDEATRGVYVDQVYF